MSRHYAANAMSDLTDMVVPSMHERELQALSYRRNFGAVLRFALPQSATVRLEETIGI
jgi:hypothetical protein